MNDWNFDLFLSEFDEEKSHTKYFCLPKNSERQDQWMTEILNFWPEFDDKVCIIINGVI